MNPRNFKAPFIPKHAIWQQADAFRSQVWPSGIIPVDIMDIVEFELGLEFRAVTSLRTDDDVDALLLGDWQTIMVDQGLFMDDRYSNRLRFSIAHELGHYVLHRTVFEQIPRATAEEWILFMRAELGFSPAFRRHPFKADRHRLGITIPAIMLAPVLNVDIAGRPFLGAGRR